MGITLGGRKGIFLKMLAHAGAIDYESIRIFYTGISSTIRNNDIAYLTRNGYIAKENSGDTNKKTYFYLTQKGKKKVLGNDSASVWDCAMYISGNAFTNRMPVRAKTDQEKVARCISQSKILSEMYHSKTTFFYSDKEDLFQNSERIEKCFDWINKEDGTASGIVSMIQAEQGRNYKEYTTIYDDYLKEELRSKNVYYLASEIKGEDNPLLRQSRALGCLPTTHLALSYCNMLQK